MENYHDLGDLHRATKYSQGKQNIYSFSLIPHLKA